MQVTINHSGFKVMRLQNNTKFFKEERYKRLQEFPKKNIKICTIPKKLLEILWYFDANVFSKLYLLQEF